MDPAPPASPAIPSTPTPAPTTPPAAPASAPEPSSADGKHPQLNNLLGLLAAEVSEEEKKEDKKPEPAAAPKPADAPEVKASATPAEKPIRVKKKEVKRPDLPIPAAPAPAPVAAPAAPAPASGSPEEQEFGGKLEDNERQMIEDAKYAEKRFPEKYKGLVDKTKKFLKDHIRLVSDQNFDDSSPEYQHWLESNRVQLSDADSRELSETRIIDRARKDWENEIADTRHDIFVRDEEPKIKIQSQQIYNQLALESTPKEIIELINKEGGGIAGYNKAKEQFGLEIEITEKILDAARNDLEEMERITRINPQTGRPVSKVATNPSDPKYEQHCRLAKIVADTCENFKNSAGEKLQKGGKWFVTRQEWDQIPPSHRNGFWTLSNSEIIQMALKQVPTTIAATIKQQHDALAARGFRRAPAAAAPATPVVPPKPDSGSPAPAIRPSPKPGVTPPAPHQFAKLAESLRDA